MRSERNVYKWEKSPKPVPMSVTCVFQGAFTPTVHLVQSFWLFQRTKIFCSAHKRWFRFGPNWTTVWTFSVWIKSVSLDPKKKYPSQGTLSAVAPSLALSRLLLSCWWRESWIWIWDNPTRLHVGHDIPAAGSNDITGSSSGCVYPLFAKGLAVLAKHQEWGQNISRSLVLWCLFCVRPEPRIRWTQWSKHDNLGLVFSPPER